MALKQYDLTNSGGSFNAGAASNPITKSAGAAIGTSMIRLTVDDAVSPNKAAVIRALKSLEDFINKDTWPPA